MVMKCLPMIGAVVATSVILSGCEKKQKETATAEPATPPPAETAAVNAPADDAEETADPNEVVASVNDHKMTRKETNELVEKIVAKSYGDRVPAEQLPAFKNQFRARVIYSFIVRNFLIDEAKRQNITVTEDDRKAQLDKIAEALKKQDPTKTPEDLFKDSPLGEQKAREEFEDGLLIDKMIKINVLDKIAVTDEDINKRIEEIKAQNEKTKLKNETIPAEKEKALAKIKDIKKRIEDGTTSFEEAAKNESDCPSGKSGGALGRFPRERMVKPFSDAAFALEIGKLSDVVETDFGYHLILVNKKFPAVEAKDDTPAQAETVDASHILVRVPKPDAILPIPTADELKETMKQEKSGPAVRQFVDDIKAKAKISTVNTQVQEMLK